MRFCFIFALILTIFSPILVFAQPVNLPKDNNLRLLGVRIVRDGDFDAGRERAFWIPDLKAGSRLQVFLRNTSGGPVTITDYAINGQRQAELPDVPMRDRIPGSKWWFAWPERLNPGELTTVRIRLLKSAQTLGDKPELSILYRTAEGKEMEARFRINPQPTALWMPFIYIADNLQDLVIYAGNQGKTVLNLAPSGALRVNDQAVKYELPQSTAGAGEVIPIRCRLEKPLAKGSHTLFALAAEDDERALGSLRAFASSFGVTYWGAGGEMDPLDTEKHHGDPDLQGSRNFMDEPIGGKVLAQNAARRVQTAFNRGNQPIMIQLTGYEENLAYGDMADYAMTHHGNREEDLSNFLTWPKPFWYLPQNAWGRMENVTTQRENWYRQEDLWHEAIQALGHGAKNIQWFSYFNLWEQGLRPGRGHRGGADHAGFLHARIHRQPARVGPRRAGLGRPAGAQALLARQRARRAAGDE